MYSKEQLNKLIDEVSRLIAIEELDKVVPTPALASAGYVMCVNAAGTGYELKNISGVVDGTTIRPLNVYATGKITGAEIVEDMSGYSVALPATTGYTKETIYYGVCKNGNKLTIVAALNITKTSAEADSTVDLGIFTIPESVGSKLFPTQVGLYNFLDNKVLNIFASAWTSVACAAYIQKSSDTSIFARLESTNMLVNTTYYVRYEATFLLSEDLSPEE